MNQSVFLYSLIELGVSIFLGVMLLYITFRILEKFVREKYKIELNNVAYSIFTSSVLFSVAFLVSGIKGPILNSLKLIQDQPGYDGIIVIGSIIGELVITFTCLLDYILASPSNQNFMFTVESIEAYLADLLCADDSQFPNNLIQLNINQSLEEISDGAELVLDQISKIVRDPAYLTDFGLNFIFFQQCF